MKGKYRLLVKHLGALKDIGKVEAHVKYIGFRSEEIHEKGFFDRVSDHADYKSFLERISNNQALQHSESIKAHKLVFSLRREDYNAYTRSGKTFQDLARSVLSEYEKEKGIKLDWIANFHNQDNENKQPHIHIVIKGVSDIKGDRGYKRIRFQYKDFEEMKKTFDNEFFKDVQYKLNERFEYKEAVQEINNGFNNILVENKKDRIEDLLTKDLSDSVQIVRAIKHYDLDVKSLKDIEGAKFYVSLLELSNKYPEGKLSIDLLDDEDKIKIESITNDIFKNNKYDELLNDYLKEANITKDFKEESYRGILNLASKNVIDSIIEVRKKPFYKIENDKLNIASNVIKNINSPVSYEIEKQNIINRMAFYLNELNSNDKEIKSSISFWGKENNILITEENINNSINYINEINSLKNNKNEVDRFSKPAREIFYFQNMTENKKIELFSATLKSVGYTDEAAADLINNYFKNDLIKTIEKAEEFVNKGLLEFKNQEFVLSDKGKDVFINDKSISKFEIKILNYLNENESSSLDDLIKNKNIYSSANYIYKKDIQEIFELSKYDVNVILQYFLDDKNKYESLTVDQIEDKIYKKVNDDLKAEELFKMASGRIKKLVENGYIKEDTENKKLYITDKFIEEKQNISKEFKFTKYDSEVIFKYIDNKNNNLSKEDLRKILANEYTEDKEIETQFKYLINRIDKNISKGYIKINESGNYEITEKGRNKALSINYPASYIINNKIDQLINLGVLKIDNQNKLSINKDKYNKLLLNNKNKTFSNEILKVLNNNGKFNKEDLVSDLNLRTNKIIKNSNLIDLKKTYKMPDHFSKTIKNIAHVLYLNNAETKEVKQIIYNLRNISRENISDEKLDKIINDSRLNVDRSIKWGRPYVINKDEWNDLYKSFNIKNVPDWSYKSLYQDRTMNYDLGRGLETFFHKLKTDIQKEQQEADYNKTRESKLNSARRKWLEKNDGIGKDLKRKILDKKKGRLR
ncbi:MAG: hypothetical protein AB7V16_11430 [Vulcanibacillus sp.]